MRPALSTPMTIIATALAAALIERGLPAVAAGLVTAAHVLHPEAARDEMRRRG